MTVTNTVEESGTVYEWRHIYLNTQGREDEETVQRSTNNTLIITGLTQTRDYKVKAIIGQCESNYTPVTAYVYEFPLAPEVSDVERCGVGAVDFVVTNIPAGDELNPNGSAKWYGSMEGSDLLQTTKDTFNISLIGTQLFYVSNITSVGCESERVEVRGTVNPVLAIPMGDTLFLCTNGSP